MMNNYLYSKELEEYCEQHSTTVDYSLHSIQRDTFLNVLQPHMISGNYQGQFLRLMSIISKPKYILEIGTYTGYSALCLAEGLQPEGQLHTIDNNVELMEKTKQNFNQSKFANQIYLHIGDALEIIPQLPFAFDLAFIDADKSNYWNYFDLIVDKMPPKSLIIADNVLWKSKVLKQKKDKKTQQMHEFNERITADHRVDNLLLPIRDGLMLIVVK